MVLCYFLLSSGIFFDRRGAGGSRFESFVPSLVRIHKVLVPFQAGGNEPLLQLDGMPWQLSQRIAADLAD